MKTKLLGSLAIAFGVFLFAGATSASDANVLQPAATITYNENLDVNGTIYASSAYIGEPGIGGVTFFNGTMVNNSADPVTIGDDVRIDGEIYRVQKGGDPIKISDNVIPTLTNINDFGTSANRWKSVYAKNANLSGKLQGANASFTGNVKIGGGYGSTGITMESNGDVKINGNLIVDGHVDPQTLYAVNLIPNPETADFENDSFPQGWIGYTDREWAGAFLNQVNSNQIMINEYGTTNMKAEIANEGAGSSIGIRGYGGDIILGSSGDRVVVASDTRLRLEPRSISGVGCSSITEGELIYDSSAQEFKGCNGSSWVSLH